MPIEIDPKALLAALGEGIVVCDAGGAIVLWNAGAERIFGHTPAEVLGQSLDIIIPERLRKRHWEGFDKTMETGITRYGSDMLRVPAVDKAGRAMSIAFTVTLLHGNDGKISAIVAVIRDETARFNDDRALRKRLTDLEAQLAAKS